MPDLGSSAVIASLVMGLVAGLKVMAPSMQGRQTVLTAGVLCLVLSMGHLWAGHNWTGAAVFRGLVIGAEAWVIAIGVSFAARQPDKRTPGSVTE